MRSSRIFPLIFALILALLIIAGLRYSRSQRIEPPTTPASVSNIVAAPSSVPSPQVSPSTSLSPSPPKATNLAPDLSVDSAGLSKSTVILTTSRGVIKYKFYTKDAPNTVAREVQLINSGFYNGLIFHRVEPGFVIQGGDPTGTGTGGSGQKLKAEFNDRRHVEGAVAMARASDPDSADSQFYISLGTHPHLDRNYTVFGQVTEGMDVAKQIQRGDKILTAIIE